LKFKCNTCDKQFLYTAKLTKFIAAHDVELNEDEVTQAFDTEETHVCPYCHNLEFDDAPAEPVQSKGKITALISAPNSNVNDYLEQGYEVMEDKIYAKDTILVKREEATQ